MNDRGGYGIRTRVYGFAGRCLASRPIHRVRDSVSAARRPARRDRTRGCLPTIVFLRSFRNTGPGAGIRADDEIRTRDPHLGKVMRYRCATSAWRSCLSCVVHFAGLARTGLASLALFSSRLGAFAPRLDLEDCIRRPHEKPNRAGADLGHVGASPVFPRETRPTHSVHPGVATRSGASRPAGSATILTRVVHKTALWAIGAVGSALPSHGRGHRFESGIAHPHPRSSAGGFLMPGR